MREINKVNCDVLIIGGGVGGLACALDLKEKQPEADVLVVEKNFAGYSGKANRGGWTASRPRNSWASMPPRSARSWATRS